MAPLAAFLTGLPRQWKAISALIGATSVGLVAGMFLVGFKGLPAQVAQNTKGLADSRVDISVLEREVAGRAAQRERIICLLTLPDSITPIQVEGMCP